jgi:hypothetical protein
VIEAQAVALVKEVASQVPDDSTQRQYLQSPQSKALDAERLDPPPRWAVVVVSAAPTPLLRLPRP